ncbi:helix-turn-helix domain-containing protein [Nostoc sp.]|uniref:helix-turn-helix domain-containing protein n=1 Tax=Nostoc sp. TaxID=1180 RepID=UPI003FA60396
MCRVHLWGQLQTGYLNAHGWNVPQIAEYLDWAEQTVRQTIRRWQFSWDRRFVGSAWTWQKTKLAGVKLAGNSKKWLSQNRR